MKKEALAYYLRCEPDLLEQANKDQSLFEYGIESYLVLTDAEADEYTKRAILDTLWAFNAEFIVDHTSLPVNDPYCDSDEDGLIESIKCIQEKLCEKATPLIRIIIKDLDQFVEDAIDADGRGHFLGQHDGSQEEVNFGDETFFIYRQN